MSPTLKVKWAMILVVLNGLIAGLTYLATRDPTVTTVIMAIVTGIEAAIHFEETQQPKNS